MELRIVWKGLVRWVEGLDVFYLTLGFDFLVWFVVFLLVIFDR
jgi:hypothetical protein